MSLLDALFGARHRPSNLAEPVRAAVARWNAIEPDDLRGPLAAQRWLVVDVETTGLNMQQDRLIAIGAVRLEGVTLRFDQSFEVVLRQSIPSGTGNILIHRITGSEQTDGVDPATALAAFLDFARQLPCVAFHAQFDQTMLKRAFKEYLGIDFSPPFLDLAFLAPALVDDAPASLRSLDDWVGHFSIPITARHRAVADAVGTAQLFQLLLRRAQVKKIESAYALFKLANDQRWLAGLNRN
ncbi:MAG: 3'-5' exonuclease [Burkholderiales bacterium]|nr:3'-5' exonuclease [Burkholderiales bacterium]